MKRRTIEPRTTLAALSVLVAPLAHALDDAGARAAIDEFLRAQKIEQASAEPMQHVVADIDGDGRPDIVLLWNVMGPTWFHPKMSVFLDQGRTYRTLTVDLSGQLEKLTVEGPLILVDTLTLGPKDPRCCPTVEKQLGFRWAGGQADARALAQCFARRGRRHVELTEPGSCDPGLVGPGSQSRTKLTRRITWYSVTLSPSTLTFCSLTHAPLMPCSVFEARAIPFWIASSKLTSEVLLISEILATVMNPPGRVRPHGSARPARRCPARRVLSNALAATRSSRPDPRGDAPLGHHRRRCCRSRPWPSPTTARRSSPG